MKKLLLYFLFLSSTALAQTPFYNNVVRTSTLSPARVANALEVSEPLASSGTNTYTFSAPFTGFAYHTGDIYTFVFGNANTSTTVTANIATLGALSIKDASGSDLAVSDLKAGGAYKFYNNGTHLRMIGAAGGGGGMTTLPNTNIYVGNSSDIATAFVPPFVFPESYGAVGDGVTDDAAAFASAIATGFPVYIGKKTYLISTELDIPSNASIYGSGPLSVLKTTSNINILNLEGINIKITNVSFLGNDTGASQTGIAYVGDAGLTLSRYGIFIRNCFFTDFARAGIYSQNAVGSATEHQGGAYISDCQFVSNLNGIFTDTRAEYNTMVNCIAYQNTTGWRNNGGNNNWIGGHITDNTNGVIIGSGTNDGHGVMQGAAINHNTTNITATSTANGFLFSACMVYVGNLTLTSTTGIRFDACEFSSLTDLTSTSTTNTIFSNCKFITNPNFVLTGTTPFFLGCSYNTGQAPISNTMQGIGLTIGNTSVQGAFLKLMEDTDAGTNYTEFVMQNQSANISYTLPAAAPAVNGYILSATTAGVMSWVADGGSGGTISDTAFGSGWNGNTTDGASKNALYDEIILKYNTANTAGAITDASTMDITGPVHTLTTSSTTRTFTQSYTGTYTVILITLNTASNSTLTFPAGALCNYNGVPSGDNTMVLSGVTGDKHEISIANYGSGVYSVFGINKGQ